MLLPFFLIASQLNDTKLDNENILEFKKINRVINTTRSGSYFSRVLRSFIGAGRSWCKKTKMG